MELGWERHFNHFSSIGLSSWFNSDHDHTGALTNVAYGDRFGRIEHTAMEAQQTHGKKEPRKENK